MLKSGVARSVATQVTRGLMGALTAKITGSAGQEVVVALDAATGKTRWEHVYDAPLDDKMDMEYGPGPHSTPLCCAGTGRYSSCG